MPYMKYKTEDMQLALQSVQNGQMTAYKAAKLYNIPYQTLWDRLNNVHSDQHGRATVLTKEEEEYIVKWIHHMSDIGFPVSKQQLLHSVANLVKELKKPNNFKDGVPGRAWYEAFLKRHADIRPRIGQALTSVRVTATEEKIRRWFKTVYEFFEKENCLDVLKDPSRIFNCDESAFFLCPKGQAVLAKKGQKSVYCRTGNDEKENLTLSLGASAAGKLMPVLALFPYKRLPRNILEKYPKAWAVGRSDNGWMTCQTFYEYVANSFNEFLIKENIQKPVALFLDGHVSHLSLPLTNFCKDNGIILVALLPNATHVLQPMDVAVFRSLKNSWKKSVHDWRMCNNGQKLKREDFAPILDKCIQQTLHAGIIANGFRATGLFPFDENAINYSKLPTSSQMSNTESVSDSEASVDPTSSGVMTPVFETITVNNDAFLTEFENRLGAIKLRQFQNCDGVWHGDIKDENLYYFWKDITGSNDETLTNELQIGETTLEANNCTLNVNLLENIIDNDETAQLKPSSMPSPSKDTNMLATDDDVSSTDFDPILDNTSTPSTKTKRTTNDPLALPVGAKSIETIMVDNDTISPTHFESTPPRSSNTIPTNTSLPVGAKSIETIMVDNDTISPTHFESTPPRSSNTIPTNTSLPVGAKSIETIMVDNNTISPTHFESTPPRSSNTIPMNTSLPVGAKSIETIMVDNDTISPTHFESTPPRSSNTIPTNTPCQSNTFENNSTTDLPIESTESSISNIAKPSGFPTPFKKSLLWPEPVTVGKGKRIIKNKMIPTVATSEEFMEYQRRQDLEKKEKLEKAELKKKEREEKAKIKKSKEDANKSQKEAISKKKKRTSKSDQASTSTTSEIVEEEKDLPLDEKSLKVGKHVVVKYEEEHYPGIIIKVSKGPPKCYDVKTMSMSGLDTINGRVNWRWPEKDDILAYELKDIVKIIQSPTVLNKRGVYSVLDM